jgi:hypothetical protein
MRVITSKTPEFHPLLALQMAAGVFDNRTIPRMRDVAYQLMLHPSPAVRRAMALFAWEPDMLAAPRLEGRLAPLALDPNADVREVAARRLRWLQTDVGDGRHVAHLEAEPLAAHRRYVFEHCGYTARAPFYDPLQPSVHHLPDSPLVKCIRPGGHAGSCGFPMAPVPGAPVEVVDIHRDGELPKFNADNTRCHACGGKHRDGAKFTGAADEFMHHRECSRRYATPHEVAHASELVDAEPGTGKLVPVSKIRTLGEAAELRIAALPSRGKPVVSILADLDLED